MSMSSSAASTTLLACLNFWRNKLTASVVVCCGCLLCCSVGFFGGLGFAIPPRKGVADFLQEVTSRRDQQVRGPLSQSAYEGAYQVRKGVGVQGDQQIRGRAVRGHTQQTNGTPHWPTRPAGKLVCEGRGGVHVLCLACHSR
jgi:hypothetical protein